MLVEKDLNKLLGELSQSSNAKIQLNGFPISIKMIESHCLYLTTPVYYGGNYIPKSVRGCVNQKAPFDHLGIKTTLVIDEENFSISLNYRGLLELNSGESFVTLIEDFTWLAAKWREYLDEHDKLDLVHMPVR